MYAFLLMITALFILSLISCNWPFKLYHFYLLNRLATEFETQPITYGMVFTRAYAELRPVYRGKEFIIRFMEASVNSLRSNTGLELRLKKQYPVIVEFYRLPTRQREWGDFKRMLTGEPEFDDEWLILTPQPEKTAGLWSGSGLKEFLQSNRQIDQVLFSNEELIVKVRRFESAAAVKYLVDQLSGLKI